MSKDFQTVIIVGTVGRDPESKSTPGGVKVVSFSVAVESGFGNSAYTEWFNCVTFKDRAEFAEKYLKKGKQVAISGKQKTRSWDDAQTGTKKYRTELIVDQLDFFGGKSESKPAQTRTETPAPTRRPANDDPFADPDSDIPF